jgi:hypothetical protein
MSQTKEKSVTSILPSNDRRREKKKKKKKEQITYFKSLEESFFSDVAQDGIFLEIALRTLRTPQLHSDNSDNVITLPIH